MKLGERGATILITTLSVTGILITLVLVANGLSFSELNMSNDNKKNQLVLDAAKAGISDGLLRITKNQCRADPYLYSLPINEYSATIRITGCGTQNIFIESTIDNLSILHPSKKMTANVVLSNGVVSVSNISEVSF
ncbi:hypothetical protein AUK11_02430 [bacterium CG2_30_37_16]|nr:MAG: hypothetical protein AUK11_02430 [bacterium CG2_30_37_16]PIP30266.1 MAG: hypothetical protein COX25_05580 [bacterium (Candidatus Howlettbacteria) CG23_combo_of_CG06-09_8_20_14_all_37_9]PIY00098.1 MAG: hypothetical protein COZ22_01130 [bacterium (Candidatus Howlettbacteria) CG_4_10_14_3_um_filter_37_10]PJB06559.1 MAG: hypothetical protein CO123_01935 [bacterium (Candidatus Howlettbacteria) CG_4_9_14_3_um_filter_37_10]